MCRGFVENRLECYRNVLFLLILKGTLSSKLRALFYVSNVRYLYQYLLQNASYITEWSSSFPLHFATNISYPFHISHNPTLPTQFSRNILSNVLDNFFPYYSSVIKSPFDLFRLQCHVLIMYKWYVLISNHNNYFEATSLRSREISAHHVHAKPQIAVGQK